MRGKRRSFAVEPGAAAEQVHDVLGVAAVEDREARLEADPAAPCRRSTVLANEWNVPPATRSQLRADERRPRAGASPRPPCA